MHTSLTFEKYKLVTNLHMCSILSSRAAAPQNHSAVSKIHLILCVQTLGLCHWSLGISIWTALATFLHSSPLGVAPADDNQSAFPNSDLCFLSSVGPFAVFGTLFSVLLLGNFSSHRFGMIIGFACSILLLLAN